MKNLNQEQLVIIAQVKEMLIQNLKDGFVDPTNSIGTEANGELDERVNIFLSSKANLLLDALREGKNLEELEELNPVRITIGLLEILEGEDMFRMLLFAFHEFFTDKIAEGVNKKRQEKHPMLQLLEALEGMKTDSTDNDENQD